jgi:hypothetical protein
MAQIQQGAQTPQLDTTRPTKVTLANGETWEYPAGTPVGVIMADIKAGKRGPMIGPLQPGTRPLRVDEQQSRPHPREASLPAKAMQAAAVGTSFIPGAGPAATALRVALPTLFSAGAEAVEGNDPFPEATFQGGMGLGGEALARGIPALTTRLALASGGVLPRMFPGGFRKAAQAFNRQAGKREMPLLVGRGEPDALSPILGDSKSAIRQAGQKLEAAESAAPHMTPAQDLVAPPATTGSRLPVTREEKLGQFNKDTVEEQVMAANGLSRAQWNRLSKRQRVKLINDTELSVRDIGETQRAVGREARPAIKAQKEGTPTYMSPDDAQNSERLMDTIRDVRHGIGDTQGLKPQGIFSKLIGADPKPGEIGAIKAQDRNIADLRVMQEANDVMRSGGPLGDLGLWSMRGALGEAAGRAMGLPWGAGSAAGLTLLNPAALSGVGFGLSRVASPVGPAVERLFELQEMFEEKDRDKKKPVQRRNP